MKKVAILLAALAASSVVSASVGFAETPTCVMMKFTDDTRFDKVDSAEMLSDLVMEKLVNTGKLNFRGTKVINQDIEKMLYNERAAELRNARRAISWGDYNTLFEGPGFKENMAQSMATATVGQIVDPNLTAPIGRNNSAEYLIQGTICNIGTGQWMNTDINSAVGYANMAASTLGMAGVSSFLGPVGPLLSGLQNKKTSIGLQSELRLIKAATGEVVWYKKCTSKVESDHFTVAGAGGLLGAGGLAGVAMANIPASWGDDKLSSELLYKVLDKASQEISDAIVADVNAGKLFLK